MKLDFIVSPLLFPKSPLLQEGSHPHCSHRHHHRPLMLERDMLLSTTKNEPSHYMLKIEYFSILSEAGNIKIESDVFEASGHKWRLDLYPNGNKEEKGDNHISLYLIICDTESLEKGWKVHVDVNFFVYDHIAHNYVIFQDDEGNRTRFHEKQMKWGFEKLISLEHFKDSNKGYIFNDSCVFGAEVFSVPEYTLKDRCLSMIKPPATMNTYTWIVDNFSSIKDDCLHSEVHEAKSFPNDWKVYARFELQIKNKSGYAAKDTGHWFCEDEDDWGFSCFILLSELRDMSKGFLKNDTLIVEAKISVVGMLKNFI
ncbi:unnamed protein product [Lactuca saligna]|uniref:MATH domain-containing protein n=1 Tax=Lactuca saligna TaxID=75948 RepID=A0AA36EPG9_LACSI|nr:unnamed protein product [Lactuca saligna]